MTVFVNWNINIHVMENKTNAKKRSRRSLGTAKFSGFKENSIGLQCSWCYRVHAILLFWEIVSAFWTAVPILLSGQVLTNMV